MQPPPFDERELSVLFAALLLAALSAYFQRDLRRIPQWRLLLAGVGFLIAGSTATIVEHFVLYDFFNTLEHFCYLAQSLMLALWALRMRRASA
jgi:fluoride ion exporter CrcB/FEX